MKILIVSFYYEPDLCAGSFRVTAFVKALKDCLASEDTIEVVTTFPNRYHSFDMETKEYEANENVSIKRIKILSHKSGFFDQAKAFSVYFFKTLQYIKGREYDVVFATSSRLFTASLGATISRKKKIPLYLDIRDIFVDTMRSVLKDSKLKMVIPGFSLVEKYTLSRADKINIVSEGFLPYFQGKYNKNYSFFPNGIDEEFLGFDSEYIKKRSNGKIKFVYTGNIGEGQGMEKIVPKIAEKYRNIEFNIVGDGGRKDVLQKSVCELKNVNLLEPVSREEITDFYGQSDILFLHLNNYYAFKKVLPSKIFEYAATYKPIIAGVDGYAKEFLEEHVPGCLIFKPCDFDDFCRKYDNFSKVVDIEKRKKFIIKFSRKKIMNEMAKDFLKTVIS